MEDYVRIVGMVILNIAKKGNVLIIGRASQVLLREHPEALHIRIIAPLSQRVKKCSALEKLTQREATQCILASDRARAEYLRRYYGVNWSDPQLYDIVFNTGHISIETAVQLAVLAQVQRVIPQAGETND